MSYLEKTTWHVIIFKGRFKFNSYQERYIVPLTIFFLVNTYVILRVVCTVRLHILRHLMFAWWEAEAKCRIRYAYTVYFKGIIVTFHVYSYHLKSYACIQTSFLEKTGSSSDEQSKTIQSNSLYIFESLFLLYLHFKRYFSNCIWWRKMHILSHCKLFLYKWPSILQLVTQIKTTGLFTHGMIPRGGWIYS